MKKTITQKEVTDFFQERFSKSSYDHNLINRNSSKRVTVEQATTIASFNLCQDYDFNSSELAPLCRKAISQLDFIHGADLLNLYKAQMPIWDIFEENITSEWAKLSDIRAKLTARGFDRNFVEKIAIWAAETGRKVNIKRVNLVKKVRCSNPEKILLWR